MGLEFKIEEAQFMAETLRSCALATHEAIYGNTYGYKEYELASNNIFIQAHNLSKFLENLTNEAFAAERARQNLSSEKKAEV